jgi:uncharacterized protein (TIGR00369 family)
MSDASMRTHTFAWDDPQAIAHGASGLSGIELMRAILRGDLPAPPITAALGFHMSAAEEGSVTFTLMPAEYHYNPIGSVHGGVAATLLDSAMGCSIHTLLPAGVSYTTLEIKVNYTRPLTVESGEVRAVGRVLHLGAKTASAEGQLLDASGKLYAHATTTCLILRP